MHGVSELPVGQPQPVQLEDVRFPESRVQTCGFQIDLARPGLVWRIDHLIKHLRVRGQVFHDDAEVLEGVAAVVQQRVDFRRLQGDLIRQLLEEANLLDVCPVLRGDCTPVRDGIGQFHHHRGR